jgi:sugar phosphate isomerase/epimerase
MRTLSGRLGCSSITFRFQSLFDALDSIHAAGLKQVDIACIPGFCDHINPLEFSPQEEQALQDRLKSLGMTVSTLNVSAGGLNSERKEYVFRFIQGAIDLAKRLGCYAVTIPTGSKAADAGLWQENAGISAHSIRKLADDAAEKGIRLTLEAPHIGTLAENVDETRRFFQLLQDPRVACTFDTSHVARGNPAPVPQSISTIGAEIGHVHLRDCIGENNHLTPGKGEIDFRGVLLELNKIGYAEAIILELEGENSQQAATELAYAINYLRQLDI